MIKLKIRRKNMLAFLKASKARAYNTVAEPEQQPTVKKEITHAPISQTQTYDESACFDDFPDSARQWQ